MAHFNWSDGNGLASVTTGSSYKLGKFDKYLTFGDGSGYTEAIEAGNGHIANLIISAKNAAQEQEVVIEFLEQTTIMLEDVKEIYAGVDCKLADVDKPADGSGRISISLPGMQGTLDVTVPGLKADGPKLEKTAVKNDTDGTVTWTVAYTAAESGYYDQPENAGAIKPTQLVDTLPAGMELKTPEEVTSNGWSTTSSMLTFGDGTTELTTGTALTYTTQMTSESIGKVWQGEAVSFNNVVQATGTDGGGNPKVILSANEEVTFDQKWANDHSALTKVGEYKYDSVTGKRTAEWTVEVNTFGQSFKTLYLTDTMGKGLTLDGNTIKVNNTALSVSNYTVSGGSDTTTKLQINFYGTDISPISPVNGKYIVKYTTEIAEEYFQLNSSLSDEDVKNNAQLYWEWPEGIGPGPGVQHTNPTVVKPGYPDGSVINNNTIQKWGVGYDATTHTLTWKVKVNPNEVDIISAKVSDWLNGETDGVTTRNGMVRVDEKDYHIVLDYADNTALEEAIKAGITDDAIKTAITHVQMTTESAIQYNGKTAYTGFDFDLGNIGKRSFEFDVRAKLVDASFWATNQSALPFTNTVTLSDVKVNPDIMVRDQSAKAAVSPSHNMLSKSATEYNPATNEMTWQLVVNESKSNELGAVTVTDVLPEGMTYEVDSTSVQPGELTPTTAYEDTTSTITWTFAHGVMDGKTATITFKTEVDPDVVSEFQTAQEVTFINNAKVDCNTSQGNIETVKDALATLQNPLITKTTGTADKNTVPYTITLNPYSVDLATGTKFYIEDTMPAGLVPDLDSIKLYRAEFANTAMSEGKYTPTMTTTGATAVTLYDEDIAYTVDASGNHVLRIHVDDKQPYILMYNAFVMKKNTSLENAVALEDESGPIVGIGSKVSSFTLSGYGGALYTPPTNWTLIVTPIDDANQIIKDSFTYELYTKLPDDAMQLLATATTDPTTGEAKFSYSTKAKLMNGEKIGQITNLYIKQTNAPDAYIVANNANDGYQVIADASVLTDLQKGGKERTVTVKNISTSSMQGKITICSTYDGYRMDYNPNPEAVFLLYEDAACTIVAKKQGMPVDPVVIVGANFAEITGLQTDKTYYVKEISVPRGYEKPLATLSATASVSGGSVTFANKLDTGGCVAINKVYSSIIGGTSPSADFGLFTTEACTTSVLTFDINGEGTKTIDGLYPDATYYVKELTVSEGYYKDEHVQAVTASKEVVLPSTATAVFTNKTGYITVTNTFDTIMGDDTTIEVQLYAEADETYQTPIEVIVDGQVVTTVSVSGENPVTIAGLNPNAKYRMRVMKVPNGYNIPEAVTVTPSDSKDIPLQVKMETQSGAFTINKSYNVTLTDPLPVAEFTVYSDAACTEIAKVVSITGEAKVKVDGLIVGTEYYVKETQVPNGYYANDTVYKITAENGIDEITVTNMRRSSGGGGGAIAPLPIKNGNITINVGYNEPVPLPYPLPTMELTVYADAACTEVVTVVNVSGIDDVVITGLVPGETYYVKVTGVSDGYEMSDAVYVLTANKNPNDAAAILDIINERTPEPIEPNKPLPDQDKPVVDPNNPTVSVEPTDPTAPIVPGTDSDSSATTPTTPSTNADAAEKLPQTGQDWMRVWLLAVVGAALMFVGIVCSKRSNN